MQLGLPVLETLLEAMSTEDRYSDKFTTCVVSRQQLSCHPGWGIKQGVSAATPLC